MITGAGILAHTRPSADCTNVCGTLHGPLHVDKEGALMAKSEKAYDAFISYSRADSDFASEVQRALHRMGRRSKELRALEIFRDVSSIVPGASLQTEICAALARSRWMILLASPEATGSEWVSSELVWWLEHQTPKNLLIVLMRGSIHWDDAMSDFSSDASSAIPTVMHGHYHDMPSYVDARKESSSSVESIAASLRAAILGVDREDVLSEELHLQRRRSRVVRAVGVGLLSLTCITGIAGLIAASQRRSAREASRLASSRQLAATALSMNDQTADGAMMMAVAAARVARTPEAHSALIETFTSNPFLARALSVPGDISAVAASYDGQVIAAGLTNGDTKLWSLDSGRVTSVATSPGTVEHIALNASGDTGVLTYSHDGSQAAMVFHNDGRDKTRLPIPGGKPAGAVAITQQGDRAVVATGLGTATARVLLFDTRLAEPLATYPLPASSLADSVTFTSSNEVLLFDSASASWEARVFTNWTKVRYSTRLVLGAHESATLASQASPTGSYVAVSNGGNVVDAWHIDGEAAYDQPDLRIRLPGQGGGPFGISRDGRRVATIQGDTIYVAFSRDGPGMASTTLKGARGVTHLEFLGASSRLLSVGGRTLQVWSPDIDQTRVRQRTLPMGSACQACTGPQIAPSPDGELLALSDGSGWTAKIVRWEPGDDVELPDSEFGLHDFTYGKALWLSRSRPTFPIFHDNDAAALPEMTNSSVFIIGADQEWAKVIGNSRDAAVAVTRDGGVYLIDTKGVQPDRLVFQHDNETGEPLTNMDGAILGKDRAVVLFDDTLYVISLRTGAVVAKGTVAEAYSLAAGGERVFVVLSDRSVEIRAVRDLTLLGSLPGGDGYHDPPVANLPGTLVARVRSDGSVMLFDVASLTPLARFLPPMTGKTGAAFSRRGDSLVTATAIEGVHDKVVLRERLVSIDALTRVVCERVGQTWLVSRGQQQTSVPSPDSSPC